MLEELSGLPGCPAPTFLVKHDIYLFNVLFGSFHRAYMYTFRTHRYYGTVFRKLLKYGNKATYRSFEGGQLLGLRSNEVECPMKLVKQKMK